MKMIRVLFCALSMFASLPAVAASGDEIQVYNDEINAPGELGVEVHTNYVRTGEATPAYPGEIPAHRNSRITPEFNYGFTHNVDGGIYIPTIRDANGNGFIEGAKLRLKYIGDNRERGFYWGINGELGHVSKRTEQERWNLEIRPILGYKTDNWHFTTNPIFGLAVSGPSHTPGFSPAFKVGRRVTEATWISVEHYTDLGDFNQMRNQGQETYLAVDTEIGGIGLNAGVGHGSMGANKRTFKAIFAIPLSK
jgi:hypothetical protein